MAGTGVIITHFGSSPLVACATIRARTGRPRAPATSAAAITSAAAPSLTPGALPAVTVPSGSNAGLSRASASTEVSARTDSSCATTMGAPFFWGMVTASSSASNAPSACASAAF
jgi:hypothetical protein